MKPRELPITSTMIAVMIMITIWFGGNTITGEIRQPEYTLGESQKLVNLEVADRIEGHFVLGTGTIESQPAYFYYQEVNTQAYQLKWVKAEDAVVHEDDTNAGTLLIYHPSFKDLVFSLDYSDRYDFYIPIGSIKQDYDPNVGGK